ncbi:trimethylamine methyltransferase family protein [Pararhodobacter sp. CCB-MM2]|uniref:trimethylamine methyltransferase family protein n=1 Tax=Pararhodobacter sp. CCB-MM2 TaxID=1786003 RepID=UPI000835394C|nr:trimethylamine methyltransferase family protein [Pararhodobacter sp. CCB-MM2]
MDTQTRSRTRRRGNQTAPVRQPNYRQLSHPFTPQQVFSEDRVAAMHDTALRVLEELGMKVLLPEARAILQAAGARVEGEMVFIGRDMVTAALASAPREIRLRAANPAREQRYAEGTLLFTPGSGCPNVTDRVRGRRPGSLESYVETLKLHQSFDVIHILGPSAEPQDVPPALRHYPTMQAQMAFSDKPMFVHARGRAQIEESLEMIRLGLDLSEDDFSDGVWAYTVINTNSPRVLDNPMAQGLIDFARAGQMSVVTPFCLAGAMAPVTPAGALVLQHAEALAAITLVQMTRAGAPVSYGGFSSNVDMKSGAPAFGTPSHVTMQVGAGQLARFVGLPWRSAAGAASNTGDMQAALENTMGLWGGMMANATMMIHSAGWLEGGLAFGYEKFINDVEALQMLAELCTRSEADDDALGFDALAEVAPAGHFFAAQHTMARYSTAFYPPLVADLQNFGNWTAAGEKTSTERATAIWQDCLAGFTPPETGAPVEDRLARYIEAGTARGGAAPLD